jgi:pyridoxine kinase
MPSLQLRHSQQKLRHSRQKLRHSRQKAPPQAGVIQDISGLGRCSLAAALPVMAALGVHACPIPTAVLTSQTGFSRFALLECTPLLEQFPAVWNDLGVALDGIYTGFMGNAQQLAAAQELIRQFRRPNTLLLIDPVMGDNGQRYPCFDESFCQAMRSFARQASVLTPNVTEACFLANIPYETFAAQSEPQQQKTLYALCEALRCPLVVVTGWRCGGKVANVLFHNGKCSTWKRPALGGSYSGTGDLFAASFCAQLLRGVAPKTAIVRTTAFLEASLRGAQQLQLPPEEGVPFELHLNMLTKYAIHNAQ